MIIKIATLITCYNRYEKTLACLKSLFDANLPADYLLSVFLVDDGSTDGTSEAVKYKFPEVNVVQGSGNLFWARGMSLAWESAARTDKFDFFLWLNDDILMDKHAIDDLLECYFDSIKINQAPSIIVGACRSSEDKNEFSYGGRSEEGPVIPNGKLQECKYINGNVVLVPNEIFLKIGNISHEYTHTMGDFDYGLRSLESGFYCYTTKSFVATCSVNDAIQAWCNPKIPIITRIKLLNDPKGINIKEYNFFRKKFWGRRWIFFSIKIYLKAIAPSIYSKIKKIIDP